MVQDKRLVVLQEKAAKGNAVAQNEVISLFFHPSHFGYWTAMFCFFCACITLMHACY